MSNEPIINQPFLYVNGLQISNDATTPNTKVDIAAGICRDSTNTYDMNLGNFLGVNPNLSANTSTTINAAVNGVNGLDSGSLAASTFYNIFVIADTSGYKTTGCILSTNSPSSGPLMPFGYGMFRYIGTILTDGSSHFLKTYYQGNGQLRYAQYDAPISALSGGAAVAYTAVDLSVAVPVNNYGKVKLSLAFTPNVAAHNAFIQPQGATGDFFIFDGIVATVAQSTQVEILPLTASSKPEIAYKVSNAADALSISVQGYEMLL